MLIPLITLAPQDLETSLLNMSASDSIRFWAAIYYKFPYEENSYYWSTL